MDLTVGVICDGKVVRIVQYGAFVQLEGGRSGMVHISEVSDGFVRDIREYLTEDQNVRVKIIKIDETGKISLSVKQAQKKTSAPCEYEKKKEESSGFEDMISRFMSQSNEKMSDLKDRGIVPRERRRRQ